MHAILFALICFSSAAAQAVLPGTEVPVFEDHFDGVSLAPEWTPLDGYAELLPADTANHAVFEVSSSQASISFPGGFDHNQWEFRDAELLRAFEGSGVYEVKLDSTIDGNQQFGIVFRSGPKTFLMFMLYANSTIFGYVERFVDIETGLHRATLPGGGTGGFDTGFTTPKSGPHFVRVTLQDAQLPSNRTWRFEWSTDGESWTTVIEGALETDDPNANIGEIQEVGFFAGNQLDLYSGFDARFDYYRTYPESLTPPPPPPDPLASTGDQLVHLWWQPILGVEGYHVWGSAVPGGPYTLLASTVGTSHEITGLTNGVPEYYVLSSFKDGRVSANSVEIEATPGLPAGMESIPQSGLILALNADQLSQNLADGDPITQWVDAFGEPTGALADLSHAPTFIASAIEGHAAARFDGNDDYFVLPDTFGDFTAGLTIFIVTHPSELNLSEKILALGNGSGEENIVLGRSGTSSALQYFTNDGSGNVSWFTTSNAFYAGQVDAFSISQPGGIAGEDVTATVYRDGASIGAGTVFVPPVASRTENYIGRAYWADGLFEGDIAEVLIYNRELSQIEREAVDTYLNDKFALDTNTPPDPPVLPAPTGVVATAGGGGVELTWTAVAGATGYEVHSGATPGGPYAEVGQSAGPSFTELGLINGQTYYYVVRAFDAEDVSGFSAEVNATPDAALPPPGTDPNDPGYTPPPDIAADGLVLLLDASNAALTHTDGQNLGTWWDASGAGHHAIPPSGAAPQLVMDGIGGQPAVEFDGVQDYLTLHSGFADFTDGLSIYIVTEAAALQTSSKLLLLGNGSDQQAIALGRAGTGDGLQYFTNNSTGAIGWFNTGSALQTGVPQLLTVQHSGGLADTVVTATVAVDGVPVGSGDVFVPPIANRTLNYIGNSYWLDGLLEGKLAEVVIYNRELTEQEDDEVLVYLSDKYGLDLATGDPDPPPGDPGHTPPAELPQTGLVVLLDASNTAQVQLDGDPVSIWWDASGAGNHATAPLGAEPVLSDASVGGQPSLTFDGVDDHLQLPSGFADFTAGLSFYIVAQPAALQPGFKLLTLGNDADQENIVLGRSGESPSLQYFTNDTVGGVAWFTSGDALQAGALRVLSLLQPGGIEDEIVSATISIDGALMGSGDVYVPPVTTRSLNYIGLGYWADGLFEGEIAEVILYDRALTPQEDADVQNYLAAKYGLIEVPDVNPVPALPHPTLTLGLALSLATLIWLRAPIWLQAPAWLRAPIRPRAPRR